MGTNLEVGRLLAETDPIGQTPSTGGSNPYKMFAEGALPCARGGTRLLADSQLPLIVPQLTERSEKA